MLSFCPPLKKAFYGFLVSPVQSSARPASYSRSAFRSTFHSVPAFILAPFIQPMMYVSLGTTWPCWIDLITAILRQLETMDKPSGNGCTWRDGIYHSVPLIRPLRKYALPLFFAQVPAQGSLTRYNAPLVSVFWNI